MTSAANYLRLKKNPLPGTPLWFEPNSASISGGTLSWADKNGSGIILTGDSTSGKITINLGASPPEVAFASAGFASALYNSGPTPTFSMFLLRKVPNPNTFGSMWSLTGNVGNPAATATQEIFTFFNTTFGRYNQAGTGDCSYADSSTGKVLDTFICTPTSRNLYKNSVLKSSTSGAVTSAQTTFFAFANDVGAVGAGGDTQTCSICAGIFYPTTAVNSTDQATVEAYLLSL